MRRKRRIQTRTRHRRYPRPSKPAKQARKEPRAAIEFCDKCGSILVPVKGKGGSAYLRCRGCGAEKRKSIRNLRIVEEKSNMHDVTVLEKDTTLMPMTEKECPKCLHARAYWWMQQTRSADEPPTQFFRCEKCKHVWREYK